jgi:RNA polymerase sigma factor (sigma-70 family)
MTASEPKGKRGPPRRLRCRKGHSLSGDNVVVTVSRGYEKRSCRICLNARRRERVYNSKLPPGARRSQIKTIALPLEQKIANYTRREGECLIWTGPLNGAYRGHLTSIIGRRFPYLRNDLEDIVQEAMISVFRVITERRKHPADVKAFLTRVAINKAKDLFGQHWFAKSFSLEQGLEEGIPALIELFCDTRDPLQELIELEENNREETILFGRVRVTPKRARRAVRLFLQGLSQKKIGLTLGISENTVEQHLRRGRRQVIGTAWGRARQQRLSEAGEHKRTDVRTRRTIL